MPFEAQSRKSCAHPLCNRKTRHMGTQHTLSPSALAKRAHAIASVVTQSQLRIAIVATIATLLIGCVDFLSGYEISWSIVYVLPIALAAWYVGPGLAYALSLMSVILWNMGEFASGLAVSSWLVPVWNSAIRLAFYYVFIECCLHQDTDVGFGKQGFARTADLSREIIERERLERELLEIGERERRRIGYDLHDGLGQHLTGTSLAV